MNASNNSPMTCADNARRGSLARLLATENLHVEHAPDAQTASFDLNSRTLTLPCWENANPHTYDMLVGHEVGHALFTPNGENGWCEAAADIGGEAGRRAAQSFLNIVEDARIERLIQNRYPGLRKDFFHGYRDIWNQGFFGASMHNVARASFPDRINMHFKVGSFITVPFFNDAEREFVKRISAALTWQEVVAISRDLFNYMKDPLPPEENEGEEGDDREESDESSEDGESMEFDAEDGEDENEIPQGDSGSGESSDEEDSEESEEDSEEDSEESEENAKRGNPTKSNAGSRESDEVPDAASTDEAIRQHMDRLNGPASRGRVIHAYLPKPILKNIVRDYKRVLADIGYVSHTPNSEYDSWSSENRKTVELMAKAFDLKKAAETTARTSIRRTGVLDTGSLHKYRFTEDIFRKSSFTRDGKNHGMILILDWSGSMSGQMLDTVKQLITLVGFCRRVAIPFEVYAFTDRLELINRNLAENGIGQLDQSDDEYENRLYAAQWEARDGKLPVSATALCLFNLFSSRMNRAETDQISKSLFNIWSGMAHAPRGYSLGGTPMNGALLAVREIAKDFRKANRIEILNTVILTDGEASDSLNWVKFKNQAQRQELNRMVNGCSPSVMVHDGESGRQWFGDCWSAATTNIVQCLRADTGTKIIQLMIGYARMATNYYDAASQKTWSEEGFIETTKSKNTAGWDASFIIKASAKEVTMDELLQKKGSTNVTTTNIKNAFIKQMKSRTSSRVLVNRITDLIA